MASIHRGIHKVPPKFKVNRFPFLMGKCCSLQCCGGAVGLEVLLWVFGRMHSATLVFVVPIISWTHSQPFLSPLLAPAGLFPSYTADMAQTHRKDGGERCPFLHSHVQTNKVIKVTASTWQPRWEMPKPRKMSAKSGPSRFSSLVSKNS